MTDRDRIYAVLCADGPQTLPELRIRWGWTTHRANQAVCGLKAQGRVRLTRPGTVLQPHPYGAKGCGLWAAVTPGEGA